MHRFHVSCWVCRYFRVVLMDIIDWYGRNTIWVQEVMMPEITGIPVWTTLHTLENSPQLHVFGSIQGPAKITWTMKNIILKKNIIFAFQYVLGSSHLFMHNIFVIRQNFGLALSRYILLMMLFLIQSYIFTSTPIGTETLFVYLSPVIIYSYAKQFGYYCYSIWFILNFENAPMTFGKRHQIHLCW